MEKWKCDVCYKEKDETAFAEGRHQCKQCRQEIDTKRRAEARVVQAISKETKKCIECEQTKRIAEFPVRRSQCKDCRNAAARKKQLEIKKKNETMEDDTKICDTCGEEQPLTNFEGNRRKCNTCRSKDRLKSKSTPKQPITVDNYTEDSEADMHKIPQMPIINGNDCFILDGKNIRKTLETPPRVSVYDLIDAISEQGNGSRVQFLRLQKEHQEVVTLCNYFKFEGQGQRKTPITDARGVVTIINLLPGKRVAQFRAKSAPISWCDISAVILR